jgi:hypothetical protein
MTELVRYDAACRALVLAKRTDEVQKIRNVAEAMRAAARLAKNRQLEVDAAEIRIRAERRLGELIVAQKQTIGLNQGAVKGKTGTKAAPVLDSRPTLADAGVDKKLSMRAQRLAAIPPEEYEDDLAEWRAHALNVTTRVSLPKVPLKIPGKRLKRARTPGSELCFRIAELLLDRFDRLDYEDQLLVVTMLDRTTNELRARLKVAS